MKTDEVIDLQLQDETVPGGRPTSTGNHIKWDKLFIRVKPATNPTLTGALELDLTHLTHACRKPSNQEHWETRNNAWNDQLAGGTRWEPNMEQR